MPSAKSSAPSLSIVIATTQAWPEMSGILESLYDQAQSIGAEIVVADGHGQGWPTTSPSPFPAVQWITMPGASVYQLRAAAIKQTGGNIIAVTEDHCRV